MSHRHSGSPDRRTAAGAKGRVQVGILCATPTRSPATVHMWVSVAAASRSARPLAGFCSPCEDSLKCQGAGGPSQTPLWSPPTSMVLQARGTETWTEGVSRATATTRGGPRALETRGVRAESQRGPPRWDGSPHVCPVLRGLVPQAGPPDML